MEAKHTNSSMCKNCKRKRHILEAQSAEDDIAAIGKENEIIRIGIEEPRA
jgi:hypothetical protein